MILGDSSAWRERLIDVHTLLVARIAVVWPLCASHFDAGAHENPMTDRLVVALRRDSIARRFVIASQHKLLDLDRRDDVVTKGFVDIAVFLHSGSEVYLAFECKRLNVSYEGGRHSLAGRYAEKGLLRYVTAQYARALPLGAMLGYVMDSDVDWASSQLAAAFEARSESLCLEGTPVDAPSAPELRSFLTRHRRRGESALFEVRHVLLPLWAEDSL